jgi:3-hydroxybutyryl-CoA dehydrogenase
MGSGIAQVAAQSGFSTILFDINREMTDRAKSSIQKGLQALVDKEKITATESRSIAERLQFVNDVNDCRADLFIEAIVENLEAKTTLFNQLAALNQPGAVFASNTSSLSVSLIQQTIANPGRVAGMHFFNPAPVMKLVEVVKGEQTTDATAQTIYDLCLQLNKVPVMCKDAPGFIVNRVARHYYLEAMKLVESGAVTVENADAIMEASGFKMGPFKLMDLIGMDINLAVSQSIYEAFNRQERFTPSRLQIEKVAEGALGRKTGKGFYNYS